MKNKMKGNTNQLFETAPLEINAICRMKYFFWYCLNTTECDFNNFNMRAINSVQKKIFLAARNGQASSLLLTLLH